MDLASLTLRHRPQRYRIEGGPIYTEAQLFNKRQGEIDVEKTLAKSTFSIKPEELVELAKSTLARSEGIPCTWHHPLSYGSHIHGHVVTKAGTPLFSFLGGQIPVVCSHLQGEKNELFNVQAVPTRNPPPPPPPCSNLGTEDSSVLADDFLFCPPVVAPLGKEDFLRIFGSFKLPDAMSDIRENAW